MIAALALSLTALKADLVAANPVECADGCGRVVVVENPHCAMTTRAGWILFDPACAAKLSDDDRAFVLAHEMAHLTGIKDEIEADRLGMTMMARAGRDVTAALTLLRRIKRPFAFLTGHPGNSKRVAALCGK